MVVAARSATHASTAESGNGRINSETTLVSRTITAPASFETRRFWHGLSWGQFQLHPPEMGKAFANCSSKIGGAHVLLNGVAQDQTGLLFH